MSSIIRMQGRRFKLEDGDEIDIERYDCGRCGSEHTKITVTRNGKEICRVGDAITTAGRGEDELYGGVMVDEKGNVLPDPHWVVHIIPNDNTGMTPDKMHYVGMCGKVLDHAEDNKEDRITWLSEMRFIPKEHEDRLCKACLGIKMLRDQPKIKLTKKAESGRNNSVGSSKTKQK